MAQLRPGGKKCPSELHTVPPVKPHSRARVECSSLTFQFSEYSPPHHGAHFKVDVTEMDSKQIHDPPSYWDEGLAKMWARKKEHGSRTAGGKRLCTSILFSHNQEMSPDVESQLPPPDWK